MMVRVVRWFVLVLFLGISGIAAASSGDLEQAKRDGLVGERPDGLIGLVVDSVSSDVQSMVDRINGERLTRYREIAAGSDASLDQVQAVAGERLIDRTPSGFYVMDANGNWRRK